MYASMGTYTDEVLYAQLHFILYNKYVMCIYVDEAF